MGMERHHMSYDRLSHTARKEARTIRNTPELIPYLAHDPHRELHAALPAVPVLGFHALQRVLSDFYPVRGDTLGTLDNLLFAIEAAKQHPKAHDLERSLADLAIMGYELQRPFILDNRNNYDN